MKQEWEDARIFAINKGNARCTAIPYTDPEDALSRAPSPCTLSLNGDWQFSFAPKPADRPIGFEDPSFDVSGWGTLHVPANWELHGHGVPIYAPFHMPKACARTICPISTQRTTRSAPIAGPSLFPRAGTGGMSSSILVGSARPSPAG